MKRFKSLYLILVGLMTSLYSTVIHADVIPEPDLVETIEETGMFGPLVLVFLVLVVIVVVYIRKKKKD